MNRVTKSSAAPRGFMALWLAAVVACAAAFITHLALRFETVRLGYELGSLRKENRSLVDAKRLLSLEAATLSQASRIETVATGVLGMRAPRKDEVVVRGGLR